MVLAILVLIGLCAVTDMIIGREQCRYVFPGILHRIPAMRTLWHKADIDICFIDHLVEICRINHLIVSDLPVFIAGRSVCCRAVPVFDCHMEQRVSGDTGSLQAFPLLPASTVIALRISPRPLIPERARQAFLFDGHADIQPFLIIQRRRIDILQRISYFLFSCHVLFPPGRMSMDQFRSGSSSCSARSGRSSCLPLLTSMSRHAGILCFPDNGSASV